MIGIDWLSLKLPYGGPPIQHSVSSVNTLTGEFRPLPPQGVIGRGSYSSTVRVLSTGWEMSLSGNPVKLLSGQNLFGADDIHRLAFELYKVAIATTGAPRCKAAETNLKNGAVQITRVDLCGNIKLASRAEATSAIHALHRHGNIPYRGRGVLEGGSTVSFGRGAKKDGFLKCYLKGPELEAHPPAVTDAELALLRSEADAIMRWEATYRTRALAKAGKSRLSDWDGETAATLLAEWLKRVEMPENETFQSVDESVIDRRDLSHFKHWKNGEDMKALLLRPTFYRQRKRFMERYGIDLGVRQPRPDALKPADFTNVVPLVRVLREPEWWRPDPAIFWQMVENRREERDRIARAARAR
jgi:hypothetical protein